MEIIHSDTDIRQNICWSDNYQYLNILANRSRALICKEENRFCFNWPLEFQCVPVCKLNNKFSILFQMELTTKLQDNVDVLHSLKNASAENKLSFSSDFSIKTGFESLYSQSYSKQLKEMKSLEDSRNTKPWFSRSLVQLRPITLLFC